MWGDGKKKGRLLAEISKPDYQHGLKYFLDSSRRTTESPGSNYRLGNLLWERDPDRDVALPHVSTVYS